MTANGLLSEIRKRRQWKNTALRLRCQDVGIRMTTQWRKISLVF